MKLPVTWALRLDELRLWLDQRVLLRLEGRYRWLVCALRRITQTRAG